ncbi:MAG TPA: hypothetical protein VFR37_04135 [Longimicrobium sp.]|nr:hypothetical protein [Longimicrobium sp.]
MYGILFTRACLPALLLASVPAAAQAPAYARTPGDTLHYHHAAQATVQIQGRPGRAEQAQRARISLAFTGGDTARAWYGGLDVRSKHGAAYESLEIPGSEMRGGFVLAVAPAGRVRTLRTPALPPPLDVEYDSVLAWQFIDFLPVLPEAPLRPGLEWTDADSMDLPRGRWRRSTRYRVVHDTVVDEVAAVVVATESRLAMSHTSEIDEELSVRTELEGMERGRFVFAPAPGLLLRRERSGTLSGTETSLLEGERPRPARQTREYTSVIELLPERAQ